MLRLLVDTHAFLWLIDENNSKRIPEKVRALLMDADNDLLVSSVVPWEISHKFWLGELPEGEVVLTNWSTVIGRLQAMVMPLFADHLMLAGRINWSHTDLFDRVLAAQAIMENAIIISQDPIFDTVSGVRRMWE